MAHFFVVAHDKREKSNKVRGSIRALHLEFWKRRAQMIVTGGPLLCETGDAIGSAFIMTADEQSTIEDVLADDPYTKADLFERVEILPWKPSLGEAVS